jgi:hypothetical protein
VANYIKIKKRRMKDCLDSHRKHFLIYILLIFKLLLVSQAAALNSVPTDIAESKGGSSSHKLFGGEITNNGEGGPVIKISSFKGQLAFMTGGRGAVTINNRFSIGGGGYGIANYICLTNPSHDSKRSFKMGYGGIELGYIISRTKNVNIICALLVGPGAAFEQNKPKHKGEKLFDDDFKIFPVIEPSLYSLFDLNQHLRIQAGISYRYVYHSRLGYISDPDISGFSFCVGLFFGKKSVS